MGYLDMVQPDTVDQNGNEKSEIDPVACSRCGHLLTGLPETAALGICYGCLTDSEQVDVLARMKLRRERTKTAVAARVDQLRMDAKR